MASFPQIKSILSSTRVIQASGIYKSPPENNNSLKTTNLLTKKLTTMKTTILKISAFVLLFVLVGASCEKEQTPAVCAVCGVRDPLQKLDWLKDLRISLKRNSNVISAKIILYKWNDLDYIGVQQSIRSTYDLPNPIFDCSGKVKYSCGGNQPVDSCSIFLNEVQKIEILWQK